jgi:hypothetical protein
MVILKQRIRMFFILMSIIFCSCDNRNEEDKSFLEVSKKIATTQYNLVYKNAKDSIMLWVEYNLVTYKAQKHCNWQLDSLICFNSHVNKCIMAIAKQESKVVNNSLNYFYGIKIENKWYFFRGATVILFSEHYGQVRRTALTFAKMHEIALKEIFGGYLTKDGKINEAWFDYHFYNVGLCGDCKTPKEFEKAYLQKVANNWYGATKDTANKILP